METKVTSKLSETHLRLKSVVHGFLNTSISVKAGE